MNEILISVIVLLFLIALVVMWFASARTRRLAIFALGVIVVGAVIVGLTVLVRVLWFPDPIR